MTNPILGYEFNTYYVASVLEHMLPYYVACTKSGTKVVPGVAQSGSGLPQSLAWVLCKLFNNGSYMGVPHHDSILPTVVPRQTRHPVIGTPRISGHGFSGTQPKKKIEEKDQK